ncbi:MAG: Ig domain protein group 2 domain protein, partial [Geminicoccaceae bacterium]|nr:Ig domain protein group 2 domain protein [Geminicoccaceae bacterium]
PPRVLLAIVITATAACQSDSVTSPTLGEIPTPLAARIVATTTASVTVEVGDSVRLSHPFSAAELQAPKATFSWRASDSTIVRVQKTGLAHGLAAGTATVTAELCAPRLVGKKQKPRGPAVCRTHAVTAHVRPSKAPAPTPPADTTPAPPADSTPAPTPPPPPGQGPLRRGVDGVKWLAGPIPPISAPSASGWSIGLLSSTELARYETQFAKYADYHWAAHRANWEQANYYDRAAIYYVWWARTGNATYLGRANAIALDYRTKYLEGIAMPYRYNASTYWHMPLGLALHYLVTGDEKSRQAVGYSAEWLSSIGLVRGIGKKTTMRLPLIARTQSPIGDVLPELITVGTAENRWRARVLQAFVLAHAINAPQNGPATSYGMGGPASVVPGTWAEKAKVALDQVLGFQNPDGSYRDEQSGGAEKPFMDGLLNDALILYYQFVSPDPRILSAVKRNLDYNWANTWLGHTENSPTFAY